jgi:DNA-binding IclR family transcriptional regulator
MRRATYVRRAGIEERTASRDLARLTDLELLRAVGETKGRHYVMGDRLAEVVQEVLSTRDQLVDPYPWMPERLAAAPRPVR